MARGGRKISTTVYLTAEQDARLHALAEATRVSMSDYIRDGIDLVLERERARGTLRDAELGDAAAPAALD